MKKILTTILLITTLITGCANIINIKAENDMVKIEIADIKIEPNNKTKSTIIKLHTTITNIGNKDISSVTYELQLLDKDGAIINKYQKTYYGEDKAIKPEESVISYFGFQDKLETQPSSYNLEIIEVKTTDELPLIHLPLKGEYLYEALGLYRIKDELPAKMILRIDRMGAHDVAEVTDEQTLKDVVEKFCNIKIYEETGMFVTDNYNGIGIEFKDGTSVYIPLNLYNLEFQGMKSTHMYVLEGLSDFWKTMEAMASPYNY